MALTYQYDLVSFDPTDAVLKVRVRIYNGASLVDTNENVPVRLPVDISGNVPTGAALTTIVSDHLKKVYNSSVLGEKERIYNIVANGGLVVNRAAIYALTEVGAP